MRTTSAPAKRRPPAKKATRKPARKLPRQPQPKPSTWYMLVGLIAYLHAALPQLRSLRSTLKAEVHLAESYLRSSFVLLKVVYDLIVYAEWQPDFRRKDLHRAAKSLRSDAYDGERFAIDQDLRTNQVRIEIVPFPMSITNDCYGGRSPRCFLLRQKCPAAGERNTHD